MILALAGTVILNAECVYSTEQKNESNENWKRISYIIQESVTKTIALLFSLLSRIAVSNTDINCH